jgi:hypothetical protein
MGCVSDLPCASPSPRWFCWPPRAGRRFRRAEIPLSGPQVDAHVNGNTLKITTKNLQAARGYFAPDGTVKGREGNRDFVGKWRIHDDMLCLDIPQFDHELCRRVVVRGDLLYLFTETGEPAGRVDVTKGNPDLY